MYFTPSEVALHNSADDCWVSFLGQVCDLTPLIKQHRDSPLVIPIVKEAGNNISHWFDLETKDVKTCIDPITYERRYYTPMGPFVHIPPILMRSDFNTQEGYSKAWWKDSQFVVGKLSTNVRHLILENTLTKTRHTMEVCGEDILQDIRKKYLRFNNHALSYTWKRLGKTLDMRFVVSSFLMLHHLQLHVEKTLVENGIEDDEKDFEDLGMVHSYLPVIHLYFNDDLTIPEAYE